MAQPGAFITLEGGEGCGKSTQLSLLGEAFARYGLACLTTREPGGTSGAESIREVLLTARDEPLEPMTETVLFAAARVDHMRKRIIPALRQGTHVLCDRFVDSTTVYQGLAGQVSEAFITMLHDFTLGGVMPQLTFILDIDPQQGLSRAKSRAGNQTRFEDMTLAFHTNVRQGFLRIAEREPRRCVVVDASQSIDAVQAQLRHTITERLGLKLE